MSQNKEQQGIAYIAEAEKHLKTGFLKWTPDYDSAAASFQKAATAFKVGRCYEKAKEANLRLADAHYRCGARFHAAKAYEEAAFAAKELKDLEKALTFYDHASDLYVENGTPDTAAMCLDKAGKIVEHSYPEWAISSYLKAAEIWESEDQNRFRQAAELIAKVARIQVQTNKFSEAVGSINHQRQLLLKAEGGDNGAGARLTCYLVLVYLHQADTVRAEQAIFDACDNVPNFEGSEEYDALHNLTEAFDERDQDKLDIVINTPLFKYMDNAYAILARTLRVPGYKPIDKRQAQNNQSTNSPPATTKYVKNNGDTSSSTAASKTQRPTKPAAVDDIEEGDLC